MNSKRLIVATLCILLGILLIWAGFNIAVDPFNAFGDRVLHWDSYTQTLNPQNSKAIYVSERFDEFDSYIIGSSPASSFLPEVLNKYTDSSFYNMFHYDSNLEFDKKLIQYLLENDDVKNIFLVLTPDDAVSQRSSKTDLSSSPYYKTSGESPLSYYLKYTFANPEFAVKKLKAYRADSLMPQNFDAVSSESGAYDRRLRNVEPIGTLADYLGENAESFKSSDTKISLDNIDSVVEILSQIHNLCETSDTKLTVVIPPMYENKLRLYSDRDLNSLFTGIASVTDYWNFSYSSISKDARYFYDATHIRNDAANMVLSRIFNDTSSYHPENFGYYCQKDNTISLESLKELMSETPEDNKTKIVPVLMYHILDGDVSDAPDSPENFRKHLDALKSNGYEPVNFDEVISFVEKGTPLPDNPVIITFDDGYTNNYETAYPILKEYGFKGTIFVIGCSVGHDKYYKNTEFELTPHFGKEEITEMVSSGLISIESHTYDMHQWPPFETGDKIRESVLNFENESESDYIKALKSDIEAQNKLFESLGIPYSKVMSFPHGKHNDISKVILRENGYKAAVTTDNLRTNEIVAGLPQTLLHLGRMTMDSGATEYDLREYLNFGK